MAEDEKKTLADLSTKKPTEEVKKGEENKINEEKSKDVKVEAEDNKSEKTVGASDVPEKDLNEGKESVPEPSVAKTDVNSLLNTLSEKSKLSDLVQETMAVKIEEKIEAHIDKEIKQSNSRDPIKFLVYSFGLGLIMVWLIWTVTLMLGASK